MEPARLEAPEGEGDQVAAKEPPGGAEVVPELVVAGEAVVDAGVEGLGAGLQGAQEVAALLVGGALVGALQVGRVQFGGVGLGGAEAGLEGLAGLAGDLRQVVFEILQELGPVRLGDVAEGGADGRGVFGDRCGGHRLSRRVSMVCANEVQVLRESASTVRPVAFRP
ncbi:hypothetical protein GCM10009550_35330 [Actinocorallia libanotica]|uniref:Uncharacterized protein n=1 Tax=Actinocorallia libanotica TaxID=46162 RepID=A0ABP4BTM1_9ACTN